MPISKIVFELIEKTHTILVDAKILAIGKKLCLTLIFWVGIVTILDKNDPHYRDKTFYIEFEEPSVESCTLLWEKVLEYAYHEALKRSDKEIFKRKAQYWFIAKSDDFIEVCELVGYDPESIRETFVKNYNRKMGVIK